MQNGIPKFFNQEPEKPEYVLKNTFNKKVAEIEATLEKKALKEDLPTDYLTEKDLPNMDEYAKKSDLPKIPEIPEIPDMSLYALKEEVKEQLLDKASLEHVSKKVAKKVNHEEFSQHKEDQKKVLESKADKSSLNEYAKKSDIEGLIDKDCVDLSEYAKKSQLEDYLLKKDLPLPQDLSLFTEKSDFEKYKGEVANTYATKKELPAIPDLSVYAKKSELNQYLTKTETSYCMVKLESDFRPYDGEDWEFEFYMGNRGNWSIQSDSHNKLSKPQEYVYHTPFDGIFFIDFCFTCRRDTHLVKPHVLQRIRTGTREVVHWDYFDNSSVVIAGNDVTSKSFIKTCSLWLPANTWIKCSMQFTNRGNNHKRKTWMHAVGSRGGYSPTYFSITGTRMK